MAIFNELDKKLTQVGKSVAQRANSMAENSELEQEEKRLEENYAILGQIYVQNNSENLGSEYQQIYEQILASERKIRILQEQRSSEPAQNYQQQRISEPVQDYQQQRQYQQQGFQGGFYPNLTEEQLPAKFKPITAWGYFGWSIIFTIPLVGIIIALIKAFGNTENINLRNFARSMFCYFVIVGILCLLIFGTVGCFAGMM